VYQHQIFRGIRMLKYITTSCGAGIYTASASTPVSKYVL
jgi:hypothetical protein